MASVSKQERSLPGSRFGFSTSTGRATTRKGLLTLAVCVALNGSGQAMAEVANQTTEATEPPLVETTAYGISGLVLWLAADGGVTLDKANKVVSLTDKTGNFTLKANSADQAPTYVPNALNGKPVFRFNGNQSLYSPSDFGTALNRDMTIIVVTLSTAPPETEQFPLYLGQNSTPHANRDLAYYTGKELFDGQFVACYGPAVVTNTFIMTGASIDSTLTQSTFYRNGKQIMVDGLAKENGDAKFEGLSNGVTLGAATDPICGWQGDIAEELVYDRKLSPTEMQQVWFYLSYKYGLTASTPTAAPATTKP